jgi:deoxyribose-phosphate aldolase
MGADARTVLGLLDLTSLETSDDDARISGLCRRAVTPFGAVAAVCVYGPFVPLCKTTLAGTGVRVATVVNFPDGRANPRAAELETRTLVAAGADEIDAVLPFEAFLRGDRAVARDLVAVCRDACGAAATLKIILETGVVGRVDLIAEASHLAIEAGADFIKTSTGKRSVGATLEAATAMLAAIRDSGKRVGLKAAGGVRTLEQASSYLDLATKIMGPGWATPATFRIGASGLLDDLLKRLAARRARRTRPTDGRPLPPGDHPPQA